MPQTSYEYSVYYIYKVASQVPALYRGKAMDQVTITSLPCKANIYIIAICLKCRCNTPIRQTWTWLATPLQIFLDQCLVTWPTVAQTLDSIIELIIWETVSQIFVFLEAITKFTSYLTVHCMPFVKCLPHVSCAHFNYNVSMCMHYCSYKGQHYH